MQSPESSEITGNSVNLEKYFTLSFALEMKVFPVSFGLLIFNVTGDISEFTQTWTRVKIKEYN